MYGFYFRCCCFFRKNNRLLGHIFSSRKKSQNWQIVYNAYFSSLPLLWIWQPPLSNVQSRYITRTHTTHTCKLFPSASQMYALVRVGWALLSMAITPKKLYSLHLSSTCGVLFKFRPAYSVSPICFLLLLLLWSPKIAFMMPYYCKFRFEVSSIMLGF